MVGLDELGFAGTLQVTLTVIFVFIGIILLALQRAIGSMVVAVVLAVLLIVTGVAGVTAYRFSRSSAETFIAQADQNARPGLQSRADEEAKGHLKIAGAGAGLLALFALIAIVRHARYKPAA
ncbi:MAG TPA: hypothetical protein VFV50_09790 [Bdellovibrionales bacterium]|nr:hypothetical protein [Bdellovibrionales bacterium]